jgi:hypothetical protein
VNFIALSGLALRIGCPMTKVSLTHVSIKCSSEALLSLAHTGSPPWIGHGVLGRAGS